MLCSFYSAAVWFLFAATECASKERKGKGANIFSNLFLPRNFSAPEYTLVKKSVVVSCFIRV